MTDLPMPPPRPATRPFRPEGFNAARVLGLIAVLGLAFACLLVLRPFLSALLWAAILVYSTWPAYRMLRERDRALRRLGRGR